MHKKFVLDSPQSQNEIPRQQPVHKDHKSAQQVHAKEILVANQSDLRGFLRSSLAGALYISPDEIDDEQSFVDIGLDSIVGVEWIKAINKQFNLSISATSVYDYSNLRTLVKFIAGEVEKHGGSVDLAVSEMPVQLPQTALATFDNRQAVALFLRESLAKALYLPVSDIDNQRPFVDLGLDSILGVEWVKQINRYFSLDISATRVYDFSNILLLTDHLLELGAQVGGVNHSHLAQAPEEAISTSPAVSRSNEQTIVRTRVTPVAYSHGFPILHRLASVEKASLLLSGKHESNQQASSSVHEKIAIVGMSGRYPKANHLNDYWQNLIKGKNLIQEVPPSRWDVSAYFDPESKSPDKVYSKWIGLLDDADCFDPMFFHISPSEAEVMDPQHRIFMQEAYRAFEDAGYAATGLSNHRCGVYLGIMSSEYSFMLAKNQSRSVTTTGNSFAIGAARTAYHLNLKGPAIPIDTACSSSLVAMHLGIQALANREIDMALAGGVSLYLIPEAYQGMCQVGMLSRDGQCKTFDNSADGFVPGEGVGAVVLKRLGDAERDGDHIYGVILGSAINQDGKTNGITAPSVNSQIELERGLYQRYGIDPETINYIETHGTGTKLGDPIELEALATVFREKTALKQYCALGSVKSNMGHTSGAAGVASVQKVLLSMRHGTLVPSVNLRQENQLFNFSESPFYVSRKTSPWHPAKGDLRRAAVSAFGFSGTNAHMVIEEYRASRKVYSNQLLAGPFAIALSARTRDQLLQKARDLLDHLRQLPLSLTNDRNFLVELAYSLQVGRDAMRHRALWVIESVEDLVVQLGKLLSNEPAFMQALSNPGSLLNGLQSQIQWATVPPSLQYSISQWLAGEDVSWLDFYSDEQPARLSLPGYPFAKESYWIYPDKTVNSLAPTASVLQTPALENTAHISAADETFFGLEDWRLAPNSIPESLSTPDLTVWVIGAQSRLTDAVFSSVNGYFSRVSLIQPHFDTAGAGASLWSSGELTEYSLDDLVDALLAAGELPQKIIHLMPDLVPCSELESPARPLDEGVYSLVRLMKVIDRNAQLTSIDWVSVYVCTLDALNPYASALSGFYRSLVAERTLSSAKLIGIQLGSYVALHQGSNINSENFNQSADTQPCSWQTELLLPQGENSGGFAEVIFRNIDEQASQFERLQRGIRLENPISSSADSLLFKEQGVYLITGGMSGIGFLFAEYLARACHARLILIGRSAVNQNIQDKLDRLRLIGAQVIYQAVDVADIDQLTTLVNTVQHQWGSLQGVIHSAGINQDALFRHKKLIDVESVISPKVVGTLNLDRVTQHLALDFFVVFSSGAGILGNAGQLDYAYANRFMDVWVEERNSYVARGSRTGVSLSIAWPYWHEGGMQVASDILEKTARTTGLSPMPTEEGVSALLNALANYSGYLLALRGDLARARTFINSTFDGKRETSMSISADVAAPTTRWNSAELRASTQQYLLGRIAQITKLSPDRIDTQETFEVYGFDSVMLTRLHSTIQDDLGDLPNTLLYEYDSIDCLSDYLCDAVPAALGQLLFPQQSPQVRSESLVLHSISIDRDQPGSEHIQTLNKAVPAEDEGAVAIVGLHARLPESNSLADFWKHLLDGKDLVSRVPGDRWDVDALFSSDPDDSKKGKIYCPWGSFIDQVDGFDADFFGISAAEAALMDPQERLFLMSAWLSLEDAGYSRSTIKQLYKKSGGANLAVYVGVTTNTYQLLGASAQQQGQHLTPSSMPWSIANRVSYVLDAKGPSVPVDTACSSSLVAIHMACQSLMSGESQIAIAGGVNLYLHPAKYLSLCQKNMLAKGSACRSFGSGDDGFIPAEAVGAFVLKPLQAAREQNDSIYAVIRASAYEHSGRSNGYASPNPHSLRNVIEKVLHKSGVDPKTIGVIEAHGTGTPLGDSLEVLSLKQAFEPYGVQHQICALSSVKSNMGHAESAAGVASLIKVILQMKAGIKVPGLHAVPANPDIDFTATPFYVPGQPETWLSSPDAPRRALVNSFGAGGVNACLLLEEPPALEISSQLTGNECLFVLSAKSNEQLKIYVQSLLDFARLNSSVSLESLCYTLQIGREPLSSRMGLMVTSVEDLIEKLMQWLAQPDAASEILATQGKSRLTQATNEALARRDLHQVADLYRQGAEVSWLRLYAGALPKRISLPGYPFALTPYWITSRTRGVTGPIDHRTPVQLHPLITANRSTLAGVRFESQLSLATAYARDHRIAGKSIFPGAAYLEIAYSAGRLAADKSIVAIKDLLFLSPCEIVDDGVILNTYLKSLPNAIEFEIVSENSEGEIRTHVQGSLVTREFNEVDYQNLGGRQENLLSRSSMLDGVVNLYREFEQQGIQYGDSFKLITDYWTDEESALVRLALPESLAAEWHKYSLHPSMFDGILQSVAALVLGEQHTSAYLPYAIDEILLLQPLTAVVYVRVYRLDKTQSRTNQVMGFNLEVISEHGEVLMSIRRFYVKLIEPAGQRQLSTQVDTSLAEALMLLQDDV